MKTIYLIRHAKSSWNFDLGDHDRPLGLRGRRDVYSMSAYVAKNHARPDLVITSTASRAFYTALHICDTWGYPEEKIRLTRELYHASYLDIIIMLQNLGNESCVALFGHNPGFTNLVNHLTSPFIDNMPTCSIVGIKFPIDSWSEIREQGGQQLFFQYPKGIK